MGGKSGLHKTSVDTVNQISIGYEATLHREERRIAA